VDTGSHCDPEGLHGRDNRLRAANRAGRPVERRKEAITRGIDLGSPVPADHCADRRVVPAGCEGSATLVVVRTLLSSRGTWLAVLALVLAAGVALGFGRSAPAATGRDRYVALGDSFSSGVGTGSYTLSPSCGRSRYAYPWLVSRQRPQTALTFVACSGATTRSLLRTQIRYVSRATGIVTVTIGGNDIDFAGLIVQCTLSDCSEALDRTRSTLASFLGSRLDTVYRGIEQRAPDARVIVLGYPRMFSGSGCIATPGISQTERSKANRLADALDRLTASRAAAFGFTYKSAIAPFAGHATCSSNAWVNGLDLAGVFESYHPNREGQRAGYAKLVRAVVG
jgi:lysophospholipase L1-like esterase